MGGLTHSLLPRSLALARDDRLSQSSDLFLFCVMFFLNSFHLVGSVLGSGVSLGEGSRMGLAHARTGY